MKDYIESQSYTLTVNEESYIIKDINYLLSSFETVFKKDSNESKIMHASVICEYMTSLLLKKKGYILKNTAPLSFIACLCEKNNLIPRECVDFLKTVSLYRTNSQGLEAGDDLTSSFLKAFSYFIRWFNRENQNKFDQNIGLFTLENLPNFSENTDKIELIFKIENRKNTSPKLQIECKNAEFLTIIRENNNTKENIYEKQNPENITIFEDKNAKKDQIYSYEVKVKKGNQTVTSDKLKIKPPSFVG